MEAEDTATAVLEFANGALGVVQAATSCWPGEPATVEYSRHARHHCGGGEPGRALGIWPMPRPMRRRAIAQLEQSAASGAADPTAIGFEMHRRQVADLVDAVRTGRPPFIPGAEGRHAIEIIEAIYRSHREARPVSLPLA